MPVLADTGLMSRGAWETWMGCWQQLKRSLFCHPVPLLCAEAPQLPSFNPLSRKLRTVDLVSKLCVCLWARSRTPQQRACKDRSAITDGQGRWRWMRLSVDDLGRPLVTACSRTHQPNRVIRVFGKHVSLPFSSVIKTS